MNERHAGDAQSRIGEILSDKYRLQSVLGQGGMGVVYRAEQLPMGRAVAVKLIACGSSQASAELQQRFRREAEAMAKLSHPNTVRLFDFGVTQRNELFLVMELLEGCDLGQHLAQRGALPLKEALHILREALGSLSEAHARGIVHRDIKPANIFLSRLGDGRSAVKLMDFGVAAIQQTDTAQKLTVTGALVGTPAYMSPEQASGRVADERSDLYALGITLFQMLTGRVPFDGGSFASVLVAHLAQPVPRLVEACPDRDFPAPIQLLLDLWLNKLPESRPRSATEALHMLELLMSDESALTGSGVRAPAAPVVSSQPSVPGAAVARTVMATQLRPLRVNVAAGSRRKLALGAALGVLALCGAGTALWVVNEPAGTQTPGPRTPVDAARLSERDNALETAMNTAVSAASSGDEPVPASAPRLVMLRSVPSGASVQRAGSELGKTPLQLQVSSSMLVQLRLPQYQSHDLSLDPDSRPDVTIKLSPSVARPPPAVVVTDKKPVPAPSASTTQAARPASPAAAPTEQSLVRQRGAMLSLLYGMSRSERQQYMLKSGTPYLNIASAKIAYRDAVLDVPLYKDIVWVLTTRRDQQIEAEKQQLRSGAITRAEYDRRVASIERSHAGQ